MYDGPADSRENSSPIAARTGALLCIRLQFCPDQSFGHYRCHLTRTFRLPPSADVICCSEDVKNCTWRHAMPDFGRNVGVQLKETASGHVSAQISDPAVAERVGEAFQLSLEISIPELQDFFDTPVHTAEITAGTVSWQPDLSDVPVHPGGQVILFRNADATRTHKFIDFVFSFSDSQGRTIDCRGFKDLENDNGLDATTDLATITLTLGADGQFAGSGIVRAN